MNEENINMTLQHERTVDVARLIIETGKFLSQVVPVGKTMEEHRIEFSSAHVKAAADLVFLAMDLIEERKPVVDSAHE